MLIAIAIAEGIQGLGGSDPVDPKMGDPVNLDKLFARTIDPYSDENLEVPLKNPVPNPADDQVASAPVQYGFIMTQSDEPNNNEVPVTSPSLPAPVKRRGRKKDSLELKAIKAQIKNDEKQKAAQRIKELNLPILGSLLQWRWQ